MFLIGPFPIRVSDLRGRQKTEEEMVQSIQDVMTPNPFLIGAETPVARAAHLMRQADVGSLIVLEEGEVCGIVTDRDITIRAVAEERDVRTTPVGEVCSREPLTLSVGDTIEQAIEVMRSNSVRRVPVLDEQGRPAGIVSLGDVAIERGGTPLGDISAAPPNH
jgi:CBS domain-containing protein